MAQGPYGPGPIWAPGPWAPGPSLSGKHLTKKRTLEKRVQIVCVFFVFWKQKRCAGSVRSFWRRYRAEISAMCQKTKVSVLRRGNVRRRRSERKFPGAKAGQKVTVRSAAFWVGKSYTATNATPPCVCFSRSSVTIRLRLILAYSRSAFGLHSNITKKTKNSGCQRLV